jgi:predicted permease
MATESGLMGLIAGALALLLSWLFLRISLIVIANTLPVGEGALVFDVAPDLVIFAYVFGISLLAGTLSGLAPALDSSRAALSSTRSGTASARSRRIQDVLVAAQVALSLVLMIAGSMAIRSAIQSLAMDPGYESKHVIDLQFQFPETAKYSAERRLSLLRELRGRMKALPGVAAISSARALNASLSRTGAISANGQKILYYSFVDANYFKTLSIPFLLGRGFQPQSVIVSESAAKELWPGRNPIGRSLRLGPTDGRPHNQAELFDTGPAYQVTAVVRDTRGGELDGSDTRRVYLQLPDDRLADYPILIRTRSDPVPVMRAIGPVVSSLDPNINANSSTLEHMRRALVPFLSASIAAGVASTLGFFGLLLASMGIYGTVSFIVVLRTREVGIRMAVGAQKRDILRLILAESGRPLLAGLVAGTLMAIGVSYLLHSLLYGINTVDGISFAGVSLFFLAVALLAAYPPSRRAIRVDPMVALRYE